LECFRPRSTGYRRIICFPHAGGGASSYHPLSERFPDWVDVRVVQYPGHQTRFAEPLVGEMDTLADLAAEAIEPYLDRPTVIFGHSMGAALAYEVVRRVEKAGARPERLFLSAESAPGFEPRTRLHELDAVRFAEEIRALGGTPPDLLDSEFWDFLEPIVRNDYRLIETYRSQPGPKIRTGIVAISADADSLTTPEGMRAWADLTDGGYDHVEFRGDHFYLFGQLDALVATVLERLRWRPDSMV
jgi:surfactin synthase thioesterase subunit